MKAMVVRLPRRWGRILVLFLLLLFLGVGGAIIFYSQRLFLDFEAPEKVIEQALLVTADAVSFRYRFFSTLSVGGKEQPWSDITGEKAGGHDVHIKGVMVNTPVEMYQIGEVSYHCDPFTQHWYRVEGYDLTQQRVLMAEVDPLSNLNFKQIREARYEGREKINGRDCWVLYCRPEVENQLLETLWKDFECRLWIDRRERLVRKAVLTAQNKNASQTRITINLELYDFNTSIKLVPPV